MIMLGSVYMKISLEQKKAINHLYKPALVLAVPGAGKTTVLIHRTYNLISKHNIKPNRILSITFSKASSIDMKNRFDRVFPHMSSSGVSFSTIHAFCYGLLREFAYMSNISYRLIEQSTEKENKFSLLKEIYYKFNRAYITEERLESLINIIGYIKNMMISPKEYLEHNKTDIDELENIYNSYESLKKSQNLIDFDDMLTISLEILQSNKYLLEKYRNKYDFFQIDEGQDTSKIQMEIIKTLAAPNNNLFIVADDDQSIYGFRGAYPKFLLNFKNEFKDGSLYFMQKNYRSTKNIVSICNKFIRSNKDRYDKDIITDNDFLEPINIVKVKNFEEQYDYILEDLKKDSIASSCVLYRNNLSAIGLMEILERNHIDFRIGDSNLKFFNHWVLHDIFSFISFSLDDSNLDLFERFYYKMKGYISKKHINYARKLNHNSKVLDRILDFPGINDFYKRNLMELKLDFKRISKLKPLAAIDYIERELGYDDYLKENSNKFGYTYNNLKTILKYLKLIAESTSSLEELINRVKYLRNISTIRGPKEDFVTLSTIHSAKGLEFDKVYIIDLIDGELPSSSSIDNLNAGKFQSMEEERRLFYVGMTRARKKLSLITIKYLDKKILETSRFLEEIKNNIDN